MTVERERISIRLTPEELEKAYRERQAYYNEEDCKAHILNHLGVDIYDSIDSIGAAGERFRKEYGIDLAEVLNGTKADCVLLHDCIEEFENSAVAGEDRWEAWDRIVDGQLKALEQEHELEMEEKTGICMSVFSAA